MGAVMILTPVVVATWPVIAAAAAGAASALGLVIGKAVEEQSRRGAQAESAFEMEIEDSNVPAEVEVVVPEKQIILAKAGVELRVGRDEQGRLKVCAKAKGKTKAQLQRLAEQFVQKMTQCFVYNRVVGELKNKGFRIVSEEVMDDQAIRIHVRRQED